jgi:ADP-heptose:LPS heptosyltransferase
VSNDLPFEPEREREFVQELRTRKFDAAFIFTSFSQSPFPPAYACYLAGIPTRIGQSKEFGGGLLSLAVSPPDDSSHQVDRNLNLLEGARIKVTERHLELYIKPEIQAKADHILCEAGVTPVSAFITVVPGASCPARRYDPERYASVARLVASKTKLTVVILGSERETEVLAPVIKAAQEDPGVVSLVGLTSVPEMAAIIRRSAMVIANNSAALHIGDAFQRPMVLTYSGTEYESQWEPRSTPTRILRRPTDCSPCYKFHCPYAMECLDIPPEEVTVQVLALLNQVSSQAFNSS